MLNWLFVRTNRCYYLCITFPRYIAVNYIPEYEWVISTRDWSWYNCLVSVLSAETIRRESICLYYLFNPNYSPAFCCTFHPYLYFTTVWTTNYLFSLLSGINKPNLVSLPCVYWSRTFGPGVFLVLAVWSTAHNSSIRCRSFLKIGIAYRQLFPTLCLTMNHTRKGPLELLLQDLSCL